MSGRQAAQKLGVPDGFKVWSPFPFAGVNQSASRIAIDDKQFYWLENIVKTGEGALRALYDVGPALYVETQQSIISFFWFNVGTSEYVLVFRSDGTAVQVAYPSGAAISVTATAGLFYSGANGQLPACCQSGTQYVLISNHNTQNDYWIWDGTILYKPGGIAPAQSSAITDGGSGYTSVPAYTVYGGSGGGVVLTPVISEGSVVSLTVVAAGSGYLPGEVVQVAFSGGGSDTSAILQAVLSSGILSHITLVAGGTGYPSGTFPLGISASGGSANATGSITFTVNPSDGDTITLNGVIWTFVATVTGAQQTLIAATLQLTLTTLAAELNSSVIAGLIVASYVGGGTQLNITYLTAGSAGDAYTLAASVATVSAATLTGGAGTAATGTFTASGGVVTSINLTSPGGGYTRTPSITFPIPGSGAIITATVAAGAVTALAVSPGGSGYTPGTYALIFTGGSGSGAQATATANASGVISSTTLIAGGVGYVSAPSVVVSVGSGALAVADINQGSVAAINVINGGTGYSGTPTLTITSGSGGSGAAATAVVTNGVITSVTMTNGGMGYQTAPEVEVQTAVNNAAAATLALMPFGVSGTTIETYQQRVWIAFPNQQGKENNGGTFFVSTTNSLTDFATSDGGDIFTNTDRFLRRQFTFLRQTSNFLYAVADSSTSVISNVQTSGNPATTTFSYQNTDPQIGSSWRDSAQDFSNTIVFGNAFGVYGLYGGSVRKISRDLDTLFDNLVLPPTTGAVTPSSAVANLYSTKYYLILATITDPFTSAARTVMLGWDQKDWFVMSQSVNLIYIGTQEINSDIEAWGTDGHALYPLFQTPSTSLAKTISTKQYGGAQSFMINLVTSLYLDLVDQSSSQVGITFSSAYVENVGLAVPFVNAVVQEIQTLPSTTIAFPQALTLLAGQPLGAMYATRTPEVYGVALGVRLVTYSADFTLRNLSLGYVEYVFTGV